MASFYQINFYFCWISCILIQPRIVYVNIFHIFIHVIYMNWILVDTKSLNFKKNCLYFCVFNIWIILGGVEGVIEVSTYWLVMEENSCKNQKYWCDELFLIIGMLYLFYNFIPNVFNYVLNIWYFNPLDKYNGRILF